MRTDLNIRGRSNAETLSNRAEAADEPLVSGAARYPSTQVVAFRANPSGWVLIAVNFPPLYDQHSGGLRLKTLIDIIGEQGWPMAFASRSTKSALPGVLSTEAGRARYETALRTAGVSRFAYGIDDVDAMIAE